MKTFKIAHLYYDLMNLYGESGNILALKKHLEKQNLKVTITNLSINDEIDFNKYDFYYLGSGNDEAYYLALKHLEQYQKEIKTAIENNKFFLATGNSLCLFGDLNILNFKPEKCEFRIVGEQTFTFKNLENTIIGFQNRDYILKFVKEEHLFEVKKGTGYIPKAIVEGIKKNNFYGTFLLGPLLIRNPLFTEYLVKEIMKSNNLEYQIYHDKWEEKAYNEYQKNF